MYSVYCDDSLLYDGRIDELQLFNMNVELELGKTGFFEFTIYPTHPSYDSIKILKSMITVKKDDNIIFYGRALNIDYGFMNEKQVQCEGALAFLLDSLIAPHVYNDSFSGYFKKIINEHNSQVEDAKQFTVGSITVGDFYPFQVVENLEYYNSLETLNARMVSKADGYLQVRYENNKRYIDFLSSHADVQNVSSQEIRLGKNLLDIKRETHNENIFTCIVPLGAKIGDSEIRIDVKPVNSGLPYIVNQEAVNLYGYIYKQVIFDEISDYQTLLTTATEYLSEHYEAISSIEITAADLSAIDVSLDSFNVGQYVNVYSDYHFSINPQKMLINKMNINLMNPADTKIVIGEVAKGITDSISSSSIESDEKQPYLIDHGTDGIWTWAKYSDNTAECFGKINCSQIAVNAALGGWYRSEVLYDSDAYPYPITFSEAPATEMMFQTRNSSSALLWAFSSSAENAKSYLPQCYLIRPTTSTSCNGNINIIAKGKI